MKNPTPDKILFNLRARMMEEEALSQVASPLYKDAALPKMTVEEMLDQARRFRAAAWVAAGPGEFHKVGLARNGQLAFSHHTVKQLRRMLAFEELGGRSCPCVRYLTLFDFDEGGDVIALPPHFRKEVGWARTKASHRLVRFLEANGQVRRSRVPEDELIEAVKASSRGDMTGSIAALFEEPIDPLYAYRRRARIQGRRTRYGEED